MFFIIYRGQTDRTGTLYRRTRTKQEEQKHGFGLYTTKRLKQINGTTRGTPLQFAIENLLTTSTVGKVPIENVEANPVVSSNMSGYGEQVIRFLGLIIKWYNC